MEKNRKSASKQKSEVIVTSGKCFEKSEQNVNQQSDENLVLDSVEVHLCLFGQRARSCLLGQGIVTSVRYFCSLCHLAPWVGDNLKGEPLCTGWSTFP